VLILCPPITLNTVVLKILQRGNSELAAPCDNLGIGIILDTLAGLVFCQNHELVDKHVLQFIALGLVLFINLLKQNLILLLGFTGLLGTSKQLLVNHHTTQRWVSLQRRILHITGLVAENGAKQLLFRRRIALALRRNLSNHDVARFYTGTNTNYTIIIKVFGSLLTDIGNITGEDLHTTLGLSYIE